jgi:YD repeat-containing protein
LRSYCTTTAILLKYASGNTANYDYNIAHKLVNLENKKETSILSQYQYEYYMDGNQSRKLDTAIGKSSDYIYDGLGRLLSETENQGTDTISKAQYTYDDYNNRKTMESTTYSAIPVSSAITRYGL